MKHKIKKEFEKFNEKQEKIKKKIKKKHVEIKTRLKKRISEIKDKEWDINRELGRKLIHLLSLTFIILYWSITYYLGHKAGLLALSGLLIILLEIEYVRIELKAKIPLLSYVWKRFRRRAERQRIGGEIFFILGAIVAFAVFDPRIATTALLMTTFGDLAAALVGKHFGNIWISKKKNIALEGVLAQFFTDLLVGFLFLRTTIWWLKGITITGFPLWTVIFIMTFTATLVETCVTKIDDNLLIPVVSGFAGHTALVILYF